MHPKDIVFRYCKIPHIKQLGYNLKKDIMKEISIYLRSTPNKEIIEKLFSRVSSKVCYNNILFFEEIGFKLRLEYQEDTNMYNILLKNSIDMPPIQIKPQVYFHYKLVNKLFEKSKKHACLSKFFDENGFLDETIFKIDYLDKMLNKIYLNDTDYITIEFIEETQKDKYTGYLSERLRIANTLIFGKEDKCKKFYLYLEILINNYDYFESFVDNIINFIEDYSVKPIQLKSDILKFNENNEISIEELNEKIKWNERIDLEVKEGFLNLEQLNSFIQKLDLSKVKDNETLQYWKNFNLEIQNEYNKSLINMMHKKIQLLENPIYGLSDNV
jgi:hypothetical protein